MVANLPVTIAHDAIALGPVEVNFQRTLRIPESGLHALPPGLGRFPLRRVADYPDTAPKRWLALGGVMLPVYQREAMWLSFRSREPAAVQVGVGRVCAVSGQPWLEQLSQEPQNYLPVPRQPWLDGINSGAGFIRQFVAVALGLGATIEGQVSGEEVDGGMQLRVVGLTAEALADWRKKHSGGTGMRMAAYAAAPPTGSPAMGLGAGGRMRQQIYTDERSLLDYDQSRSWRVFVHLCSAAQWTAITGELAPPTPIDRETYVKSGLPWFDYYDADAADLAPSEELAKVKPVGEVLGIDEEPFTPVSPNKVVQLKDADEDDVADGESCS